MTHYQVTIGYKAVIVINVKSDSESDAKEKALEIMRVQLNKMYKKSDIELQDDSFDANGILNMDETWNML